MFVRCICVGDLLLLTALAHAHSPWPPQVLRLTLNCTLPVELVWHGAHEMDRPTLEALQRQFGPLRGYDVTALPYPAHQRRP